MKEFFNNLFDVEINRPTRIVMIIVAIIVFLLDSNCTAHAETKRVGNTFEQVSAGSGRGSKATETKYAYVDSKGVSYTIWLSVNGHAFIKKTSEKTGNTYNKYLDEETSRTICKEMGREYIPSKSKSSK